MGGRLDGVGKVGALGGFTQRVEAGGAFFDGADFGKNGLGQGLVDGSGGIACRSGRRSALGGTGLAHRAPIGSRVVGTFAGCRAPAFLSSACADFDSLGAADPCASGLRQLLD